MSPEAHKLSLNWCQKPKYFMDILQSAYQRKYPAVTWLVIKAMISLAQIGVTLCCCALVKSPCKTFGELSMVGPENAGFWPPAHLIKGVGNALCVVNELFSSEHTCRTLPVMISTQKLPGCGIGAKAYNLSSHSARLVVDLWCEAEG
eukprot:3448693-Amphidinium_carterae.1